VCIGASFAMIEVVVLRATLMRALRFFLVAGHKPKPVARVTLRLGAGMPPRVPHDDGCGRGSREGTRHAVPDCTPATANPYQSLIVAERRIVLNDRLKMELAFHRGSLPTGCGTQLGNTPGRPMGAFHVA
jgi:hypothetical protein